ncbi:hypothetical protein [Algibacter sp. L4_22]|uniref:hypothetical protein n=1 Tax=Algibacter sp. L4_22 TaxID=2942477 RepID=UPI00201B52F6|nr:hypothetical protein [Algibacter sp. L4_22]MCL5127123.1 hypothetical protein [Algibacter sp. L4_22]
MIRTELKNYESSNGEVVQTKVLIIPALIKSIGRNIRKNKNGTKWRLCQARITMPNKTVTTVPAQLFERSYEMFPENFIEGEEVELEVQTEGDGKGLAKMQLPSLNPIDVDAFMFSQLGENQEVNSVKDNIVDEELVV